MNGFMISIGLLALSVLFLLWKYNRKSISEALRKRERDQQIDTIIRNQNANRKKHERDLKRQKMRSAPVDPDDPWNGVRGA